MYSGKTATGEWNFFLKPDGLDPCVEITWEQYQEFIQAQGKVIAWHEDGMPYLKDPDPPTVEEIARHFSDAVQQRLDDFVKARNYDSILSACTYATDVNPQFKAEGKYALRLRSETWAKCYEIMGEVLAGQREIPTLEEFLAELPAMEWPN
jgi:hypothetical protein